MENKLQDLVEECKRAFVADDPDRVANALAKLSDYKDRESKAYDFRPRKVV